MKKKAPTLSGLKKRAWKLFSEWVRRRSADAGGTEYCYTCLKPAHWKELHAGHAIPGRTNSVLFDEDIVKPQCPICNIWKGGQYHIFATRLIKERGLEWWESKLSGSREVVKLSRSDIDDLICLYKKKLEKLNDRRTGREESREEAQASGSVAEVAQIT